MQGFRVSKICEFYHIFNANNSKIMPKIRIQTNLSLHEKQSQPKKFPDKSHIHNLISKNHREKS